MSSNRSRSQPAAVVIRADAPEEFVRAWHRIRGILEESDVVGRSEGEAAEILIEAYLSGHEVAVEGIVVGGDLLTLAILDKPDPMEGPFFEETIPRDSFASPGQGSGRHRVLRPALRCPSGPL